MKISGSVKCFWTVFLCLVINNWYFGSKRFHMNKSILLICGWRLMKFNRTFVFLGPLSSIKPCMNKQEFFCQFGLCCFIFSVVTESKLITVYLHSFSMLLEKVYFSSKNGPNLFKSYSWTEWVYSQYLNTTRWGSKIAKSKLQLKKVRGPKVKAVVKNHQKIFKVSFLVIILSSITSISWIITIKIVFNSNFVFMNPQPLHSFFKILKNYTYFRCTGLLHSSKLVHLDVKK